MPGNSNEPHRKPSEPDKGTKKPQQKPIKVKPQPRLRMSRKPPK